MTDDNEEFDPIENLDIGESTVVNNLEEFCFWGSSAADPFVGSDRQVDNLEITDARFVGETGNEGILLEIEGEITRQLPRGAMDFPEATEPSEPGPRKTTGKPETTSVWKRAASFGIGLGISVGVFVLVFNAVNDALASAEPITFSPQPVSTAVPIVVIGLFALVILRTLIDPPLRGGLR